VLDMSGPEDAGSLPPERPALRINPSEAGVLQANFTIDTGADPANRTARQSKT
jgi:hypothetical protein